jgi:hypothetical protein
MNSGSNRKTARIVSDCHSVRVTKRPSYKLFSHSHSLIYQAFMSATLSCLSRYPRNCLLLRVPVCKPILRSTRATSIRSVSSKPFKMPSATSASELLSEKLKSLRVATPLLEYPNCFPEVNPVDIYRAHLTSILTEVTGVDANIVYPALQWTQTLEKGDLVLPVPALRIKGKKPAELAAEWVEKVSRTS